MLPRRIRALVLLIGDYNKTVVFNIFFFGGGGDRRGTAQSRKLVWWPASPTAVSFPPLVRFTAFRAGAGSTERMAGGRKGGGERVGGEVQGGVR